jgi:hypothetical protein
MLPTEIPEELRECAIEPDEAGENEAAWAPRDALRVVDALEGTRVAIRRAQAYTVSPDGFIPTEDTWACGYSLGETATGFGLRSRAEVRSFIASIENQTTALVGLEFSEQGDAA